MIHTFVRPRYGNPQGYGAPYGFLPLLIPAGIAAAAVGTTAIGANLYRMVGGSSGPVPAPPPGAMVQAPPGYDPTQAPIAGAPDDPNKDKWPAWALPVGLTVGALLLFGGAALAAVKLDKRRSSSSGPKAGASVVSKVKNPRRKRARRSR